VARCEKDASLCIPVTPPPETPDAAASETEALPGARFRVAGRKSQLSLEQACIPQHLKQRGLEPDLDLIGEAIDVQGNHLFFH